LNGVLVLAHHALMGEPSFCRGPGCERETREGRTYCDGHQKQAQRGKKITPLKQRLSPEDRMLEAAIALADADPADDAAYELALREVVAAGKGLGRKATGDAIRRGMAAARARGVRPGPRLKLAGQEQVAQRLVQQVGPVGAARALGVSYRALMRAIGRSQASQQRPAGVAEM
jgi:hypothetical protein